MTIGDRLKQLRDSKGLTQKDFCKMAKIKQSRLSEIEANKNKPSFDTLVALKNTFEISLDWLVNGECDNAQISENVNLSLTDHEQTIIQKLRDLDERDREDVFDIISMKHERRQNSLKARERFQQSTSPSGKSDTGDNHITA